MYYLYFIGLLCITLGFSFLIFLEANDEDKFNIEWMGNKPYGLFLIMFGLCVVFSAKVASFFL